MSAAPALPSAATVAFALRVEDLVATARHVLAPATEAAAARRRWLGRFGLVILLAGLLLPRAVDYETAVLGLLAGLAGLSLWLCERALRSPRALEKWSRKFAGEYRLEVTPAAVTLDGPLGRRRYAWQDIRAIERVPDYTLIRVGSAVIPIPDAALVHVTRDLLVSAHAAAVPAARAAAAGTRGPLRALAGNLGIGLRLLTLRRVDPDAVDASLVQMALLIALMLGLVLAFDFATTDAPREFDLYGLAVQGTLILILLFSVTLIAELQGDIASTPRLLVLALAANVVLYLPCTIAAILLHRVDSAASYSLLWLLYIVALVAMLIAMRRAIEALYRPLPAWGLAMVSLFAVLNYAIELELPSHALFYTPEVEPAPVPGSELNIEDTLAAQPGLLATSLARLEPGAPGHTDVYFLGFAGDAGESVFRSEARYARNLFDRRFGTRGRSLMLVNSMDTVGALPLASTSNLEAALAGVGQRMDRDDDVLVLFLTSHGSAEHELSVQFGSLPLNQLVPAQLRRMLDHAAIKWRIIVVSACYSGGFVDALRDEHTLVITAAATDRTSFGCENGRELTYFGEALLAGALTRTHSLIDAFAVARLDIEAREHAEDKLPSQPQIYIGAAIRDKLDRLAPVLARQPAAPLPELTQ